MKMKKILITITSFLPLFLYSVPVAIKSTSEKDNDGSLIGY